MNVTDANDLRKVIFGGRFHGEKVRADPFDTGRL